MGKIQSGLEVLKLGTQILGILGELVAIAKSDPDGDGHSIAEGIRADFANILEQGKQAVAEYKAKNVDKQAPQA